MTNRGRRAIITNRRAMHQAVGPVQGEGFKLRNRHLREWRFLLFTIIVTVNCPIWSVIRIKSPPFGVNVTDRLSTTC